MSARKILILLLSGSMVFAQPYPICAAESIPEQSEAFTGTEESVSLTDIGTEEQDMFEDVSEPQEDTDVSNSVDGPVTETISDESYAISNEEQDPVEEETDQDPETQSADEEVPVLEEEQEGAAQELEEKDETDEKTIGASNSIDPNDVKVSLPSGKFYVFGKAPEVTVTYKGKTLVKGTDYVFSPRLDYKATGTTGVFKDTIVITGINKYANVDKTKSYTVYAAPLNSSRTSVATKSPSYSYTGWARKPVPVVRYQTDTVLISLDGSQSGSKYNLTNGKDFTLSYNNNTNAGTATVTVHGKGLFTGTKSCTFKLVPVTMTSGNTTAKTKSPSYTYMGWARKPVPIVTVKHDSKVHTLKAGTDFTVSYKNNLNVGTATVIVTGKGNYKGTVTTTFKLTRKSISKASVSLTPQDNRYLNTSSAKYPEYKYTGKPIKPAVKVVDPDTKKVLKAGTDYTVSYSNNTAPSDYSWEGREGKGWVIKKCAVVTITGKGNYSGSAKRSFLIWEEGTGHLM